MAAIPSAACDRDWFRISLQTGRSCRFHLNGIDLADPTLALRDGSGNQIVFNDDFNGRNPQISFTATANGTYFLDAGAYGSGTGSYNLLVVDTTAAADTSTADSIADGGSRRGGVNFNTDRDWFRISLQTGRSCRFHLNGIDLADPTLALRDGSGNQIAFNDDFNGRNPQISFTATANGTYFLDAGSYGSGTVRHSLEATQIEEASNDYSADVLTRGNVSIGREASGSIDFADDRDWFRVSLATGRTHTLTLIGNRLPDPRLSLISTDERTILATNDDFDDS